VIAVSPEERKAFNKNYLIRYYPDSKDTNYNRLVGLDKARELVGEDDVFQNMIKRVEDSPEDKVDIRLRRGVRFTFVGR